MGIASIHLKSQAERKQMKKTRATIRVKVSRLPHHHTLDQILLLPGSVSSGPPLGQPKIHDPTQPSLLCLSPPPSKRSKKPNAQKKMPRTGCDCLLNRCTSHRTRGSRCCLKTRILLAHHPRPESLSDRGLVLTSNDGFVVNVVLPTLAVLVLVLILRIALLASLS